MTQKHEVLYVKSSVDEPPKVELKDLPPHLEYAFLEGDNKLPVIIAKELGDEEKSALIKKQVEKLLDAELIYPISDSLWVSLVHCVPKKGGFTVVKNEENELIPTRLVTGWRVCIDYHKLNEATRKDHFPLPFMDQMLKRFARNEFYCFLDGFSGYFKIPIDPRNQEKTTFTSPYRTFAYRRMPFGLCNAPGTFQRCMLAIFHDMVEKTMEVFMDDFPVFENSFENCLSRLDKMLQRCEDTNLSLNWEKSHFMVKEGIVLGHKISKNRIEVDRAKVDVIAKLPHPTTVKDCIKAFQTLKKKLTEAPILIAPNWDLPFELMCDTSDFAIGADLGQLHEKHLKPIHYASKTMNNAESNYTTKEKEMLAVVYAFEKFRSYLIINKSIVHTDHSAVKYLFAKKDAKIFSYSLEEFAQIHDIPCEGACVFIDKWSLNELAYSVPMDGPYQTNHPSPYDIILYIRIEREGKVCRIRHKKEIDVHDHQILTHEIVSTLKTLEENIWENVFCLEGNRDHVPTCLGYMLYCVANSEKFNLAYWDEMNLMFAHIEYLLTSTMNSLSPPHT
nr:reverse transcriptase domain-containing protein [Tanacetum cinerariifolium]